MLFGNYFSFFLFFSFLFFPFFLIFSLLKIALQRKEQENEPLLEEKKQAEDDLAYALKKIQELTATDEEKNKEALETAKRR
jgi:hypothetical protein